MKKYIIGITGASGCIIGIRLMEELLNRNFSLISIITTNAYKVIEHELGAKFQVPRNVQYLDEHNFLAPVTSSSFLVEGMVITPCSMKTLAAIANGYADNLVARAADNQLRTGRPLILVPRETPLSVSHLENMIKLKQAGAIICPPMVAYYHHPQTIDEMTNFFVGKILDLLNIPNELYKRWNQFS